MILYFRVFEMTKPTNEKRVKYHLLFTITTARLYTHDDEYAKRQPFSISVVAHIRTCSVYVKTASERNRQKRQAMSPFCAKFSCALRLER